ncbi:restriction endonuclease subunit S [Anaerovibrio lipolyticus]|uniref:restriction endonuclease subunit S n=1 Tax=Anaerovibrio lipolyticus TaxID=82374 RepID=UPI0023F4561F|nr:restriction endonuclease subunit S [Anaerovibrio lipolyticus]
MKKIKFSECVEYMIKGPFGSDMKKSLYVPKGDDTYKVYIQGNAIQKDQALGDYYVSEEYFHKKLERFEVHPGDYIITCDGTLGKFLKLDEKIERGVISSSLLLLKLKEDVIYDKYFELIWEYSMLKYLASQARNACLVHLPSAKAIGDVEILLPDLEEQIKLADRAFAVGNVVEKRAEELEMLDELIKARFVEMFGDPVADTMKWGQKPLKDFLKSIRYGTSTPPKFTDYGYAFIRATNIKAGRIVDDDMKFINQQEADRLEKCKLSGGEIIIVRSGVNAGDTCIITDKYIGQYAGYDMIIVLNEMLNPTFLNMLINTTYMERVVKPMTRRAAQPHLNAEQTQSFPIICVPRKLQDEFAEFVQQVDKSKFINCNK